MTLYRAPLQDIDFLLHAVMGVTKREVAGYSDLEPGFTSAVLSEAGKLAETILAPLNAIGDQQGCQLENGVVRTPEGFKAAFDAVKAGGWTALDGEPAHGGQGLPYLMYTAVNELFASANMAFHMYQGLTHGAYSAIRSHGSPAQKALYLPKLASCDWTGTMNLTEPHCGTDLGLLRSKALPQEDGSYKITGQKIFISSGDHDLAENIVHLVLARAPGGGEGTKGISLFIVPKILPQADGSLGAPNAVAVGKVEAKMGIHGNATCVMNYDGATGWLLGDLHKGMRAMFTMMNEARLGVGLQGYAQAEAAYQNARDYAQNRLQGRAVTGAKHPDAEADPLIVHPDIRRMLMDQKSFVEAARALTYWGAVLIDQANRAQDAKALALVGLLTPVIKAFLTDKGFEATVLAQQIYGGHGYIEEQGMSQFARDARIAMIYEGANGVQGLDLVGRKIGAEDGAALIGLFELVEAECDQASADPTLAPLSAALRKALGDLQKASAYMMKHGAKEPLAALAGANDYLQLMGHLCLGLMWLRMASAAQNALQQSQSDTVFCQTKLATARYYMSRHLPATALHLARIESGADPVMALSAEAF